jgi:fatty acid desaturase
MRSADRKYPDLEPYYREFEKDEARKCLRRDAGACVITVAAICLTWASGLTASNWRVVLPEAASISGAGECNNR